MLGIFILLLDISSCTSSYICTDVMWTGSEGKEVMFNARKVILSALALALLIYLFTMDIDFDNTEYAWGYPLAGQIIVIDPGHGGPDGGASSKEGLVEKDVSLAIAIYLRDFLEQGGAMVKMTRETDIELSTPEAKRQGRRKREDLKNRVHFINEAEADMFISIHLNAIDSPRWRGAQTFYHPQDTSSEQLAKAIQAELIRNLENTDRQAKKSQDIFMLRNAKIPGALVEVGFLSNPDEAALLSTAEYQKSVAASIYTGILLYIDEVNLKSE